MSRTSIFLFMLILFFAIARTSEADYEGTIGTRFTITDTGFGTKKPRVYLEYEKKSGVVKKVYAKVGKWSNTSITSLWKGTLSPGTYKLWVKPDIKGAVPVSEGTFTIVNPIIDEITPGTLITDATITINGRFFTSKKPRVYLRDLISQKKKRCRVLSSTMDPETGASYLSFVVPKWGSGNYEVNLQNLVGKTSFTLVSIAGKVTDSSTGNGISGVSMNLDGTHSNSVSTDDDGAYTFTNIQNGNYTVAPTKSGFIFSPQSARFAVDNSAVMGQDFVGTSAPPAAQLTLSMSLTSLPTGTVNIPYYEIITIAASGGNPPYTYSCSISGGSGISASLNPPGSTNSSATCTISGTPTTSGIFTVDFSVTDSAQFLASMIATVNVEAMTSPSPSLSGYLINDFNFYPVPNIPKPDKGGTIEDPTFHSKITRITDVLTDSLKASIAFLTTGYPKHDSENADGFMLIMQGGGDSEWVIWNANPPYNRIQNIPTSLIGYGSTIDVRWDATDPDILYYNYNGRFMKYSVSKNTATLLHDFRVEYPPRPGETVPTCRPDLKEEGEASADSRYWAFSIYCYDGTRTAQGLDPYYDAAWVLYDKDLNGKDNGGIVATKTDGIYTAGFTSMSPSGKYIWVSDEQRIYDTNWNFIVDLNVTYHQHSHADWAINSLGHESIFGCAVKYVGAGTDGVWFSMYDLVTGQFSYLAKAPLNTGWHFSGNSYDKPGWGVVSTYYPKYPAPDALWGDHEIFMVELKPRTDADPPARVWRIAQTHTVCKGMGDDPFAKINKRGTKIYFGTAWGQSNLDGAPYDVYRVELPSTWYQDLMK